MARAQPGEADANLRFRRAAAPGLQVHVQQEVLAGGDELAGAVLQAVKQVQLAAFAGQELRGDPNRSRTWQCTTAAPARAASMAPAAICRGLRGTCGLRSAVAPAPVTAAVMNTSREIVRGTGRLRGPAAVR